MDNAIVPIMKLSMTLKSNDVLKAFLHDRITYRDGKEYCTIADTLHGLAILEEVSAFPYSIECPSFSCAGFGVVDTESQTVPLIMESRKILDAPLEALKTPETLIGKTFNRKSGNEYKILDTHATETGNLYLAYIIA